MSLPRILALVAWLAAVAAHAAPLRWAAQNDIVTLDPHSQNHATTLGILQHVYEGLVRYDKAFQVEPALATSWRYVAPDRIRFALRKGVRFHDGSPFTADDVVFSYQRIVQPQGTMQIYAAGVKEVRKLDALTVDFILAGPNPVLLRNLVDLRIMSKAWAEKHRSQNLPDSAKKDETFASRNANGTGAYVLKAWQPEQRVTLAANPAWWDKRDGNVTEVTYLPIRADATRVAALLAGDVDLVTDLPTQDVARLRKAPSLKVLDGHEVRTIFIGMDQASDELKYSGIKGRNPFKDPHVRKALNMAVDREAIRRVVMRGLSIPAGILVAPGVHGHSKEIDIFPGVDPAGAKRLLAAAGYPEGFDFTLDCPNDRYVNDQEICQALVGMWAQVGVKVRLQTHPMGTLIQRILNLDHSAYMLGWGPANFDASHTLYSLAHSRTGGAAGRFNVGRISDARLDALIAAINTEMDAKKRDKMLREALLTVRDNHYYIPLHHQIRPWAMKKAVTTQYKADDRPEARFTRID